MIFRQVQSSKTTPSYKTASSQSWGAKPIIETGGMRMCVRVLLLALVAIFISYCSAYHVSTVVSYCSVYHISESSPDLFSNVNDLAREKRQVETFDTDDYPTTGNEEAQDEPGFWDRVVRIAVKLFSRFIEWLNS
ncbi:hypothetical protein ABMA28_015701 [Loxostege sticticalis]|uniref:Uncharacterized protein n=1 Tax=Loxostege sticticalis TaxID=481309 RepID=A0ABD0TD96_LOXSC